MEERLASLLEMIPRLSNRDEIFDLTCRISTLTQDLTLAELATLSSLNNFHVKVVFEIFNNEFFIKSLETLLRLTYEERISPAGEDYLTEKQTIQLFLRLSFFLVAVLLPVLDKQTVIFLRRHLGYSIESTRKQLLERGLNFTNANLLFLLEEINFDIKYRFQKRTPKELTINTDFLNMGQISSRIIVGSLLMYRMGYWVLPELITEITEEDKNPGKLFQTVLKTREAIGGYTNHDYLLGNRYFSEERKASLKKSLSVFKDENIEDLMFLLNEMSLDFRSKESHTASVEQKMKHIALIKTKIQSRFETIGVFSGARSESNWSNKVFLNTIRLVSVFESLSTARDQVWKIQAVDHFFNEWMRSIYEIVNFYKLNDIGAVAVYVEGESDRIIFENAYNKLFPGQNKYVFYDAGGSHELFKKINATQISDLENQSFGIFDFDSAWNDFNGLRGQTKEVGGFGPIQGAEGTCLFRVRKERSNTICAALLPVPQLRKDLASKFFKERSILSIELLFEDSLLQQSGNLDIQQVPGGTVPIFTGDKMDFAKKTAFFQKNDFKNFEPLFRLLNTFEDL